MTTMDCSLCFLLCFSSGLSPISNKLEKQARSLEYVLDHLREGVQGGEGGRERRFGRMKNRFFFSTEE